MSVRIFFQRFILFVFLSGLYFQGAAQVIMSDEEENFSCGEIPLGDSFCLKEVSFGGINGVNYLEISKDDGSGI